MAYSKQPSTKRNQEPNVHPEEVSGSVLMLLRFMMTRRLREESIGGQEAPRVIILLRKLKNHASEK